MEKIMGYGPFYRHMLKNNFGSKRFFVSTVQAVKRTGEAWKKLSEHERMKYINEDRISRGLLPLPEPTEPASAASTSGKKCACITNAGTRCSRNAKVGSEYCFQHQNCTNGRSPVRSPVRGSPKKVNALNTTVEIDGLNVKLGDAGIRFIVYFVHPHGERERHNEIIDLIEAPLKSKDPFNFVKYMKQAGISLKEESRDDNERYTIGFKIVAVKQWPIPADKITRLNEQLNMEISNYEALGSRTADRLLTKEERKTYASQFWQIEITDENDYAVEMFDHRLYNEPKGAIPDYND